MRVHALQVTAFGPFGDTVDIDVDALSTGGLFLLTGPTGAGKTSVLDAICFGLFGRVPGDRQQADRLRSDHAAPGVAPAVRLDVTLGDRRLRLTRSPRWQRPSTRARSGWVVQQASVLLQEADGAGGWCTLSTRIDEAQLLLDELLGMTLGQFTQVAMLAQGHFQDFLRAGADERRHMLERLFGTAHFHDVEQWLVDRRQRTRIERELAEQAARSAADKLHGAAHLDEPVPDEPAAWPQWATSVRDAARRHRDDLSVLVEQSRPIRDAAREAHAAAVRSMAARSRGQQARRRIEERAATAEQTAQQRAWLSAADRAREVAVLLAPLQDAAARLSEARRRVQHAMDGIGRPEWESHPLDDVIADVQAARSDAERAAGRERALAEDVDRLATLDRQAHAAQNAADEASAVAAALRAAADAAPAAIEKLQAQIQAGLRLDAAHDHLAAQLTAAQTRYQAALALPSAQRAAEQASAASRRAFDDYRTAVDARIDVVRRRIDGAAAALARQLVDGEPCLVCGSAEHPQPATAAIDPPSDVDEQSAHLLEEAALARREATERASAAAAGEVTRLSQLACGESPEAAKAAVARLDDDYRLARAARHELPSAQQELAVLQASGAEAQLRLQAACRREGDLQAAAVSTRTAASDLRARVSAVLGPELDIHALSEQTRHQLTRLGRALEGATSLRSAVASHTDAVRRVDELARAHGFSDAEDAAAALLDSGTYRQLKAGLEQRDQQAAADAELLADESIVAALAGEEVDLAASARVAAAADEMYDRQAGDLRSAERTAARLDRMTDELTQQLEVWRPLQQVHELTAGLASLVEGKSPDNAHRMSLSAYVLAARLEQVVAAANERLTPMTSGRYLLEHTVDKCAGDRKAARGGLGLLVRDAWTGDARDPATLSGGETFQTSLALALGLADVVGQEVGGTQLQTVFVDEGFGSLDADSLDDVLDELDRLRDGGRVVGVVSHVEAMRERIPTQLRVVKGRRGGSLVSQG